MVHVHQTEVVAFRSELLSLRCPQHPVSLAPFPACADSRIIMRQDCSTHAEDPLPPKCNVDGQWRSDDMDDIARRMDLANIAFGGGGLKLTNETVVKFRCVWRVS